MDDDSLRRLQAVMDREIPMCVQMGVHVCAFTDEGLIIEAPLEKNRNHQLTGFAGSLNGLCTVGGWGLVNLIVEQADCNAAVVIRRSSIRYIKPVVSATIRVVSTPPDEASKRYFLEMLREKGMAKLDLSVEIACRGYRAVVFQGSYVASLGDFPID